MNATMKTRKRKDMKMKERHDVRPLMNDDKRYVWMVTVDRTSEGKYENGASSCIFATRNEAVDFVNKDIRGNVVAGMFSEVPYCEDEIDVAVSKCCSWHSADDAQYRNGNTIIDYKISRVAVPGDRDIMKKVCKVIYDMNRECMSSAATKGPMGDHVGACKTIPIGLLNKFVDRLQCAVGVDWSEIVQFAEEG